MSFTTKALILLTFFFSFTISNKSVGGDPGQSPWVGMWIIDVEGGGVSWLNIHDRNGYLDGELLWIGGSVLPVAHIYQSGENKLVVTRTRTVEKKGDEDSKRSITMTNRLDITRIGDHIFGTMSGPNWQGTAEYKTSFVGTRLDPVGPAPDLSSVKYGQPIDLFDGTTLKGWSVINSEHRNGFKIVDGILVNEPVQDEEHHIHYGNLRTDAVFEDFNLKLEVNVPKGNNSGVYLRGLYEVQVLDSYGKDVDAHHMGAIYSRITPRVAAERLPGEWQSLDITLCDRHITVILNGQKIIDNAPVHGPTGGAISSDVFAAGPIYLQGDHGKVMYRNMVLTPILH